MISLDGLKVEIGDGVTFLTYLILNLKKLNLKEFLFKIDSTNNYVLILRNSFEYFKRKNI